MGNGSGSLSIVCMTSFEQAMSGALCQEKDCKRSRAQLYKARHGSANMKKTIQYLKGECAVLQKKNQAALKHVRCNYVTCMTLFTLMVKLDNVVYPCV